MMDEFTDAERERESLDNSAPPEECPVCAANRCPLCGHFFGRVGDPAPCHNCGVSRGPVVTAKPKRYRVVEDWG